MRLYSATISDASVSPTSNSPSNTNTDSYSDSSAGSNSDPYSVSSFSTRPMYGKDRFKDWSLADHLLLHTGKSSFRDRPRPLLRSLSPVRLYFY